MDQLGKFCLEDYQISAAGFIRNEHSYTVFGLALTSNTHVHSKNRVVLVEEYNEQVA